MAREVETTTRFVEKSDGIEARMTMPAATYSKLCLFLEDAKVVMEGTDRDMPADVNVLLIVMKLGLDCDLDRMLKGEKTD